MKNCSQKKIKCGREHPSCTCCIYSKIPCVYSRNRSHPACSNCKVAKRKCEAHTIFKPCERCQSKTLTCEYPSPEGIPLLFSFLFFTYIHSFFLNHFYFDTQGYRRKNSCHKKKLTVMNTAENFFKACSFVTMHHNEAYF